MIIKGIKRRRSGFMMILCLVAMAYAINSGIRTIDDRGWLMLLAAAAILVLMFYEVNLELSQKGVDSISSFFHVIKRHKVTPWEKVTKVYADFISARPNAKVSLEINKGVKILYVEEHQVQTIFDWAQAANPDVEIKHNRVTREYDEDDSDEYEELESRPQNFHEFADEARKIKQKWADDAAAEERAKLLQKPDMSKVKVVKARGKMKGWK